MRTPANPCEKQKNGPIGENDCQSVADDLRQETERLRELATKLEARAEALAEMEANYPHFKRFVYERLKEEFARDRPPMEEDGLVKLIEREGGEPLSAFIHELEAAPEAE